MILEGNKVYLRNVQIDDVNHTYYEWMNDKDTNQYMETRFYPQTIESIRDFVTKHQNKADEPFFAICDKYTNKHIGNIKLGPINYIHRTADISYFIGDKSYRGQGVATEAINLVCQYAFDVLGLAKLKAGTYNGNIASESVLKKNGFILEGTLRKQVYTTGGQRANCCLWGLLAEEYYMNR